MTDIVIWFCISQIHEAETSEIADHFRRHALSDNSTFFYLQCSHSHNHFCESFEPIKAVERGVKQLVDQFDFTNRDDKDDIIFRLKHAELGIPFQLEITSTKSKKQGRGKTASIQVLIKFKCLHRFGLGYTISASQA